MKNLERYNIDESGTIKDAIAAIQGSRCRCVVITNASKKVVGVFSEGDVLKAILSDIELYTPLKRVVKPSFHYLNNKDMAKAYDLIKQHGITLVPIIDEDFYLKDVVTIFDFMDHSTFVKKGR